MPSFVYTMPIEESVSSDDGKTIKVKGIAVKAGTSRNGRKYVVEELEPATNTMKGKNIKMNHSGNVEDNVGIVTNSLFFNEAVNYEATARNTARHPDVVNMIQNKLIQHVSIEADIDKLIEDKDDEGKPIVVAKGIKFTGLAFVDTPGVEAASVGIAEAFDKIIDKNKKEESFMEEKIKVDEKVKELEDKIKALETEASKYKELYDEAVKLKDEDEEDEKEEEKIEDIKEKVETDESKVKEENERLKRELKEIKMRGTGIVETSEQKLKEKMDNYGIRKITEHGEPVFVCEDTLGFNERKVI